MDELKPCPLCGEAAERTTDGGMDSHGVCCSDVENCGVSVDSFVSAAAAGRQWNRRAEPAPENGGVWLSDLEAKRALTLLESVLRPAGNLLRGEETLLAKLRTSQMQEGGET